MVPTELKITDLADGKTRIVATFSAADVSKIFIVVRRAIAYAAQIDSTSDADLPGILLERLGEERLNSMYLEGVASFLAAWAVNSLPFQTILEPKIEPNGKPVEGADFTVSLEVTRKPQYELSDYGPVSISSTPCSISDEDVDGYVEQLVEDYAELVDAPPEKPVEAGDHVIVDIRTSRGGEPVPELTEASRGFDIGEGWFSKTFDDNVIGMLVGETKTFSFEALDSNSTGVNDTVLFTSTITLLGIKIREIPEVTDEWVASKIDGADSVDDLKRMIRAKVVQKRAENDVLSNLVPVADALVARLDAHVSDAELEFEINEFLRKAEQVAMQQGTDLFSYFASQGLEGDALNEFLTDNARAQILRGYALDAYYRHENLQIDDEDIELVLQEMSGRGNNLSSGALREEYERGGRMYILREAAQRLKANRVAAERAVAVN